jgi:hypothetical protein
MSIQQSLPKNIPDLIKLLEQNFPLKHYSPAATLAEVHRDAGKRDVVEYVKSLYRESVESLRDRD